MTYTITLKIEWPANGGISTDWVKVTLKTREEAEFAIRVVKDRLDQKWGKCEPEEGPELEMYNRIDLSYSVFVTEIVKFTREEELPF